MSGALTLAAVEGRKLLRNPAFLAGVAMALVGIALFVNATVSRSFVVWRDEGWTVNVGFVFLALFTLVGANLAALRDRREHTTEQHRSLPMTMGARTGGLLLATLWPAAAAAALLAVVAAYAATATRLVPGDIVLIAERVIDVVMLGALGIAIARWVPSPFVAPAVAWALFLLSVPEHASSWHVLMPFVAVRPTGLAMWHLAYAGGLTAIGCAFALVKDGRRPALAVGIGGMVLVAVSIGALLPRVCPSGASCLF